MKRGRGTARRGAVYKTAGVPAKQAANFAVVYPPQSWPSYETLRVPRRKPGLTLQCRLSCAPCNRCRMDQEAAVSLVCRFGSRKLNQARGKIFAVERNIAILVGFRLRLEVGEIELPRIEQV